MAAGPGGAGGAPGGAPGGDLGPARHEAKSAPPQKGRKWRFQGERILERKRWSAVKKMKVLFKQKYNRDMTESEIQAAGHQAEMNYLQKHPEFLGMIKTLQRLRDGHNIEAASMLCQRSSLHFCCKTIASSFFLCFGQNT